MTIRYDSEVLVVGGGPVGLTLAIDLAQRGTDVMLVETRAPGEPPSVRCQHVSARTMEIFRRLGLASAVRDAGLPANYTNDVAFRTTVTGLELGRISIPCRAKRYTTKDGPDTWWPTPEPPHRINQLYLEPVLFARAVGTLGLRILSRTSASDFEQIEDGVLAIGKNLDTDKTSEIFARYLIGCDGAHSTVRRRMGAALSGDTQVVQVQSTYIRASRLLAMMPGPAWAIDYINPRSCGLVFAIDGRERWLIHHFLRGGERPSTVDRERGIREILGVGPSFQYETSARRTGPGGECSPTGSATGVCSYAATPRIFGCPSRVTG